MVGPISQLKWLRLRAAAGNKVSKRQCRCPLKV